MSSMLTEAFSPTSASSRSKRTNMNFQREVRASLFLFLFSVFKLSSMRFLLSFVLLICLLTSCSSADAGSTLRVALSQEPPTMDVHVNSSQTARYIMAGNVFERLVTLDSEGHAVPELCQSFESENDCRSWIFHLRKGVLFHNGREMTSEDAVLSLNRWIEYNSSVSTMLDGARFYAVDDYTLRIDAETSILFLPDMMAGSPQSAVIYAREMLSTLDQDGLITQYIGTGPYTVSKWDRGVSVTLERFDSYCPYGGQMDGLAGYKHAYIPEIIYYFVPDSFARTAGCESGQYHFINDMMNDDVPRLLKNDELVVSRGPEAGSFVLLLNKREGLMSRQYARTALNTALDLDVVMAACYGSGGYTMHPNYMESGQKLWVSSADEPRYDVSDKEAARKILDDNGYSGQPVRILSSNLSNMDKSALALADELEKAGFETEVTIADWAAMMAWRSDPSRWDVCITAMTQVPVPSLKLFLSPDYAGWSDDETLQQMMASFSSCTSADEARELWLEIQDYCYDYLPAIVCGHYQSGYLYRKELTGVNENYGFYFFNSMLNS